MVESTATTTCVAASSNRKLTHDAKYAPMSATYTTQRSCSDACPFKGKGCYGEASFCGITTRRLNKAADALPGLTPETIAQEEAAGLEIGWPTDGRDCRLHIVGDSATALAARLLSDAVARCQREGAGIAFTYTHSWRDVPRNAWGSVSVLASCETMDEVWQAYARGYAACLVVPRFPKHARHAHGIACPAQTGTADSCARCRLCMRDRYLHKVRKPVLFAAHGSGAGKIQRVLWAKMLVAYDPS